MAMLGRTCGALNCLHAYGRFAHAEVRRSQLFSPEPLRLRVLRRTMRAARRIAAIAQRTEITIPMPVKTQQSETN
jgi:hypothetical protein